jgi:heat shock protein HslJ
MRMRFAISALTALLAASCSAPPPPAATKANAASEPRDDGSYLERIDPLGGQWQVERIASEDFRRFDANITFQGGGFLNHGAGCGGGHPAFYRLDGQRLTISRREPVRTGKCERSPAGASAAAASEVRLGRFLDQATGWARPDGRTLLLRAADGTEALLTRPIEPQPELAGRWLIETIAGQRFVTERRPPVLSINRGGIGAAADCNSLGTSFTVPAPGRLSISGGIIQTQMGCPAEDLAEDALMARAIAGATGYRVEGDRLVISGGPGMSLRRPAAPDRRLAGNYESCGNTLLGGYHEGAITLRFASGSVTDNAGCSGTYRTGGPDLAVTLGSGPSCSGKASSYVPGEAIPVGGPISTLAVLRPDGFAFTDDGQLVLRTHRGLLTMCRKGKPKPFGSG